MYHALWLSKNVLLHAMIQNQNICLFMYRTKTLFWILKIYKTCLWQWFYQAIAYWTRKTFMNFEDDIYCNSSIRIVIFFNLLYFIFWIICMWSVCVCLYVCVCLCTMWIWVEFPWRPEEGFSPLKQELQVVITAWCGCWEAYLQSLHETVPALNFWASF